MAMFHNAVVQLKLILLSNRLLLPQNRMTVQSQSYNLMTILPRAVAWKTRWHIKTNITRGPCTSKWISTRVCQAWSQQAGWCQLLSFIECTYCISGVSRRPVGDLLGRFTVILKHPHLCYFTEYTNAEAPLKPHWERCSSRIDFCCNQK